MSDNAAACIIQARSLQCIDTEYTACSVEFCPSDQDLVVCGTYQLVPDESATVAESSTVAHANGNAAEDAYSYSDESSPRMRRVGRCLVYRRRELDRL